MKKSLLFAGIAGLAAMSVMTGCASKNEPTFAERVQEIQNKIKELDGLENHKTTDSKGKLYPQLPRLSLNQTKALYISWSAVARGSAVIRFGEADVVSVIRDATDTANLKLWDAIRNSDANPENAKSASLELKKLITQSYSKNKTISKMSDNAIYDAVIGKIAQEDYITYKKDKKALDKGKEPDYYKNQKTWLAEGKKNIKKAAKAQKKMLADAEARMAKAEKEAEAVKKEINMTIKYTWKKAIDLKLAEAQLEIAKVTVEKGLPAAMEAIKSAEAAVKEAENKIKSLPAATPGFVKNAALKGLDVAKKGKVEAIKRMEKLKELPPQAQKKIDEVKAELAAIKKEYPNVDKSVDMPNLKFDPTDMNSVKTAKEELTRLLEPWFHAFDMGTKRFTGVFKAKSFAREAQNTLDEVSGE